MTVERFIDIGINNTCFQNNQTINSVDCNFTPWVNNSMHNAFYNCINLKSVSNINQNVTNTSWCFYNCSNLSTTPTIPSNVTNIAGMFDLCQRINVAPVIPNTVINMYQAFASCYNLLEMPTIPNSVKDISQAFMFNPFLENAPTIPNSVTDMHGTFYNCASLNNVPDINVPQCLYMTNCFNGCVNLTDINISAPKCTNISDIFNNCSNLTNVHLEFNSITNLDELFHNYNTIENATIISQNARSVTGLFRNCTNLTTVNIDFPSVTGLPYTFYNCQSLISCPNIPPNVTSLTYTFMLCSTITAPPTIPNSVTTMQGCFYCCTNLESAPLLPENLRSLTQTFGKTKITDMPIIPASVTSIMAAFAECYELVNVTPLPQNVTNIMDTFFGANKLTTAPNIPIAVINMRGTFDGCTNLTGNIYIESSQVNSCINCFNHTSLTKNVYIPFFYANNEYTETYNSFNTEYPINTINGTVYGTPTNDNGVISGFSTSNYIRFPELTLGNNFEFGIKFTYIPTSDSYQEIVRLEKRLAIAVHTDNNNVIHFNTGDGNSWLGTNTDGITPLISGNTYWIKIIANSDNTWQSYISANGIDYNLESSGTFISQPTLSYYLGAYDYNFSRWFNGSIDLKECYIKVNGQKIWSGYIRPNGVILKDIDGSRVTINPTPSDAIVKMKNNSNPTPISLDDWTYTNTGDDYELQTYIGNSTSITIPTSYTTTNYLRAFDGEEIEYIVEKEGYETTGGTVIVDGTKTVNVPLTPISCIVTINPIPTNATVTLEADGYTTVSGTGTQSITVNAGTEVSYSVSKSHYVTKSGTITPTATESKFIELALDKHTFTLNVTPNDAEVKIMVNGKISNGSSNEWVFESNKDGDVDLRSYIGSNTAVTMPTTFTVTNTTITADYGSTITYIASKEGYATVSNENDPLTLVEDTTVTITLPQIVVGVDISEYDYTNTDTVVVLTKYIGDGGDITTPELEEIEV